MLPYRFAFPVYFITSLLTSNNLRSYFLVGYHVNWKIIRHREKWPCFLFLQHYEQNLKRTCTAGEFQRLNRESMGNGCVFTLIFAISIISLMSSGNVWLPFSGSWSKKKSRRRLSKIRPLGLLRSKSTSFNPKTTKAMANHLKWSVPKVRLLMNRLILPIHPFTRPMPLERKQPLRQRLTRDHSARAPHGDGLRTPHGRTGSGQARCLTHQRMSAKDSFCSILKWHFCHEKHAPKVKRADILIGKNAVPSNKRSAQADASHGSLTRKRLLA